MESQNRQDHHFGLLNRPETPVTDPCREGRNFGLRAESNLGLETEGDPADPVRPPNHSIHDRDMTFPTRDVS